MTGYSVQDIFREYGLDYIKTHNLSKEQWKVFNAIRNCKTSALGTHTITCNECHEKHVAFNSCRNRHCPMCQAYAREVWIQKQNSTLLDCPYFHIVTTIPSELNEIFLYNPKICYEILFKATSQSILELCKDPKWLGAKVGITSILHTWGQTLEFHPHIHSIVTGGGLTADNKWIECKEDYLIKVQVLSSLFCGKFLAMLKEEKDLVFPEDKQELYDRATFYNFLAPLYEKSWITYIEPPKGSPENVIEYIGRYSFRVAISNNRIKDISNGKITFEYKDYKDEDKIKTMVISADEFIRRFLLHVLPHKFSKIRHFGLLSNRGKKAIIALCRILIGTKVNGDFSIFIKRKLKEFKCPTCGCTSFSYEYKYNCSSRPCAAI